MPKNDPSDWTEFAKIRAEVLTEAVNEIRRLAARASGAAQDAQGATSKPEADAAPRGAKQLRRMPNSDMVEAGRKAMEPEKFVSHCRALWVWNAMWDAAPEVATPDMDYGGPAATAKQEDAQGGAA
jgi:hypothetical protein